MSSESKYGSIARNARIEERITTSEIRSATDSGSERSGPASRRNTPAPRAIRVGQLVKNPVRERLMIDPGKTGNHEQKPANSQNGDNTPGRQIPGMRQLAHTHQILQKESGEIWAFWTRTYARPFLETHVLIAVDICGARIGGRDRQAVGRRAASVWP